MDGGLGACWRVAVLAPALSGTRPVTTAMTAAATPVAAHRARAGIIAGSLCCRDASQPNVGPHHTGNAHVHLYEANPWVLIATDVPTRQNWTTMAATAKRAAATAKRAAAPASMALPARSAEDRAGPRHVHMLAPESMHCDIGSATVSFPGTAMPSA